MTGRVDRITVTLNIYQEFAGHSDITFDYEPLPDDPLVAAALAKLHERNAIAIAGGLTTFEII
jgi:hypothetical protein